MLEVCVWAWYKRSQTLWHLRREEVWQCWSNSSGESGHSPRPPPHRRQHCVCVCVCVLHYVYTSTWALSYTLHPFRFDQLCLHEPSQRSGYSISQHLLCAEACSGGPCACRRSLRACWSVCATAGNRELRCHRRLCCCCCWSFSPALGHGDRGKSRFRCLICETIGEKLKGGRLQWHDWDDECSFDRS